MDPPYLYRFGQPLIEATFLERPHRFSTLCRLADGSEVESHLADPGRLREILEVGRRLWLEGPFGPPRKLAYSTVSAELDGDFVCLQSQMPNRLFPILWNQGHFPTLQGELRREVTRADSRFDFQVGSTLVEIKGLTLHLGDGLGAFPDAPSARARKHVNGLAAHVRSGGTAAIVFLGGHAGIRRMTVARHIDPDFAAALGDAIDVGVSVQAVGVVWDRVGARSPYTIEVLTDL